MIAHSISFGAPSDFELTLQKLPSLVVRIVIHLHDGELKVVLAVEPDVVDNGRVLVDISRLEKRQFCLIRTRFWVS